MPIFAEFLCFHGILRNLVLDGDKGTNTAYFGGVQATILYVYMISHDCYSGFDGRSTENIKLSLSQIWPVNFVDNRLYVSVTVAVTSNKYCIFGWVQRPEKINYCVW